MRHLLSATCSRGIEPLLAQELLELGVPKVEERRGAVLFAGDLRLAYTVALWSRLASRVLLELACFPAADADQLYAGVRGVDWSGQLGPDQSLTVDFVGVNEQLRHSGFSARVVKDAVCDAIRDRTGRRPDVNTERPDLRLHVHLSGAEAALSVDLAGEPLHLRGLDRQAGEAPLKENLAATILRIAGWTGADERTLLDPMCGSGTLLIEAGMVRRDIAPGLLRRRWGFDRWRGHQRALWEMVVREAMERRKAAAERKLRLVGVERDPDVLALTRRNAAAAGLDLRLTRGGMEEARPPRGEPGLVVTNPPYGLRLGDEQEARETLSNLGDVLRQRFLGWTAFVLVGSTQQVGALGLKPSRRIPIKNGPLDARLVELRIAEHAPLGLGAPGWRKAPAAEPAEE
ncbi:MAG: hypothetical protein JNM72_10460 [Deltaproteobacteria bacterium]|nr:hypothetical protein [Deltaproteobacteria bacterium]